MRPTLLISGGALLQPYVGVGMYTLRLVRGLLHAGHDGFKILLPEEAREAAELLPSSCCIQVRGRPPSNGILKGLYWMEKISARAVHQYPEAIFHSPGAFWSRHRPRKLVLTLHDCIYRHFPFYMGRWFIRKWLIRAGERYAAKAQLVLTDSLCSARDLQELAGIPAGKIHVLYPWLEPSFNPVSAAENAPGVRSKYGLPERYLLYVGGYDYRKNVEFLIRAYAAAIRKTALPPLVLAGGIPTRITRTLCDVFGAIRETALLIGENVLLPGFIADADMPGLYGGCEMLVYPSLYEGFGFPPVEAIACGKPALVGDNSSLREVVGPSQNRFSTESSDVLADLLIDAHRAKQDYLSTPDPRFEEGFAIAAYLQILNSTFPEISLT